MFKKEVRARIDAYYIWAIFCAYAASQKTIWYFHLLSISCCKIIFRVQQMKSNMATSRCCVWISKFECNKWRALWQQADAVDRVSNSEYNKWRALWQQADAVFEFQIPSATNEKQYGNKQMLFEFQIPSATNEKQYGENLLLLLLLLSIREKRKTMRA